MVRLILGARAHVFERHVEHRCRPFEPRTGNLARTCGVQPMSSTVALCGFYGFCGEGESRVAAGP